MFVHWCCCCGEGVAFPLTLVDRCNSGERWTPRNSCQVWLHGSTPDPTAATAVASEGEDLLCSLQRDTHGRIDGVAWPEGVHHFILQLPLQELRRPHAPGLQALVLLLRVCVCVCVCDSATPCAPLLRRGSGSLPMGCSAAAVTQHAAPVCRAHGCCCFGGGEGVDFPPILVVCG